MHALVDAFVAAAGEHQLLFFGQLMGGGLGEALPRRGRHDRGPACAAASAPRRPRRRLRPGRGHGGQRLGPGLGLHDHAGAAAVGGVVHGAVPVRGEVAQVVDVQLQQAVLAGLADQREFQGCQVLREDADDVDSHLGVVSGSAGVIRGLPARRLGLVLGVDLEESGRRGDQDEAFADVDFGDDLLHEGDQDFLAVASR